MTLRGSYSEYVAEPGLESRKPGLQAETLLVVWAVESCQAAWSGLWDVRTAQDHSSFHNRIAQSHVLRFGPSKAQDVFPKNCI